MARYIHEGGLSAQDSSISDQLLAKYSLRPILRIEDTNFGQWVSLLALNGAPLDLQLSELFMPDATDYAHLMRTFALAYDAGAVLHHCASLAKAYEAIATEHSRTRSIPSYPGSEARFVSFASHPEPYFEFDALLSANRRLLDKTAHCLWQTFERKGHMPNNAADAISVFVQTPKPLVEILSSCWTSVGAKLKDFRDCTQHFTSVDPNYGAVTMRRLSDDYWSVWAHIPDNPEVKTRKKFTYALNLDALTYAWQVSNEILATARQLLRAANEEIASSATRRT